MAYSSVPAVVPGAALGAPGAAGCPPGAVEMEAAHAELRRAALALELEAEPVIDLAPAGRALENAFRATYDAFDRRADPVVAVRIAMAAVDEADAAIAPAASSDPGITRARERLAAARSHFARAEERLARLPPSPPAEPPDLAASIDVPRLHVSRRPSIAPAIKVRKAPPAPPPPPPPRALPEPKTFEELRAVVADMKKRAAQPPAPAKSPEPPALAAPARVALPGFVRDLPVAIDDAAFYRNRTRECFEEVAMVGMQRAPLLGDAWRATLSLERRMLASLDVIAAIGAPAIEHVPRLVADAPLMDPTRAFAIAMILGCIGGRDALGAAEYALLASERDAAFIDAFGAALALVPHDGVPLALRSLLADPDARIRAMAIDVLGRRGLASVEELMAAAADASQVAARALVHLAHVSPAGLGGVLEPLAGADDPALSEAVWAAMALSNHQRLGAALWAAIERDADAVAATWLAIAGDEEDARKLTRYALAAPSEGLLAAVGWAGDAWAIGQLIELLGGDRDDDVKAAAAEALERITGAGLVEPTEVQEDDILVEEPPEPDLGEPRVLKLARTVGDPRDPPPEPARELVDRPSRNPDRWRAYWFDKGTGYDMNARYRRGRPYTPLVSLFELDTARMTAGERRLLQRELVVRTGAFVRFDPDDFVVVQEAALRAWQPVAARASSMPGRWVRSPRRAD